MIHVLETTDYRLLADLNEEIQTLHHQLYPTLFNAYDRTRILLAFEQLLADSGRKAFVVFLNDVAAGYAVVSIKTKVANAFNVGYRALYIDQIAVLTLYRLQGLGNALLERIYTEAHALGITRIELDHWTANTDARSFFQANEFRYFNEKMVKLLA